MHKPHLDIHHLSEILAAHHAQQQQWLHEFTEALQRQQASNNAVQLRGAQAIPVGSTPGAVPTPTFVPGALLGFALEEATGVASASVTITDRATGDLILPVTLTAGGSVRDWFAGCGIAYTTGLSVTVTSGSVTGVLYLRQGTP